MEVKPICKYGLNCKKGSNCDFRHSKIELMNFKKFTKPCIYGTKCRHLEQNKCTFYHPQHHYKFRPIPISSYENDKIDLRLKIKKRKKKNYGAGKIAQKDKEIEHMRKFLTEKVIENAEREAANLLAQEELQLLRLKNQAMTEALEQVNSKISRLESLRKK